MEEKNLVQTAVIAVSVQEWNEHKAIIRDIADRVKTFVDKESEYLTPKEVCGLLKIGRATYERFWRDGKITVCNIPGTKRRYVRRSDVMELLASGEY